MRNRTNSISSVVSSGAPGSANGKVLDLNDARSSFYIQNLGTGILYVALGDAASTNRFNYILKNGSANDDGNGGVIYNQDWIGPVAVSGQFFGAAGLPRYAAWELV